MASAMVLRQVLRALQSAQGPVNLDDLSRKLGVERSALEGMMAFWVRKGRLRDVYVSAVTVGCADDDCGASCPGASSCPLMIKRPRFFSLVPRDDEPKQVA